MSRSALTILSLVGFLGGCNYDYCANHGGSFCDDAGDTGGAEPDSDCIDFPGPYWNVCFEKDISYVTKQAMNAYLDTHTGEFHPAWDEGIGCGESVVEYPCFTEFGSFTCHLCWNGQGQNPAHSVVGDQIAIEEMLPANSTQYSRNISGEWDFINDDLSTLGAPLLSSQWRTCGPTGVTCDGYGGADCNCACAADSHCPTRVGEEEVCIAGECIYTSEGQPNPPPDGPEAYGFTSWSQAVTCGTGDVCDIDPILWEVVKVGGVGGAITRDLGDDLTINPTSGRISFDVEDDGILTAFGYSNGDTVYVDELEGDPDVMKALGGAIDDFGAGLPVEIKISDGAFQRTFTLELK